MSKHESGLKYEWNLYIHTISERHQKKKKAFSNNKNVYVFLFFQVLHFILNHFHLNDVDEMRMMMMLMMMLSVECCVLS